MTRKQTFVEWSAERKRRLEAKVQERLEKREMIDRVREARRAHLLAMKISLDDELPQTSTRFGKNNGRIPDPYVTGVIAQQLNAVDVFVDAFPLLISPDNASAFRMGTEDAWRMGFNAVADDMKALRARSPDAFDHLAELRLGAAARDALVERLIAHRHVKAKATHTLELLSVELFTAGNGRKPANKTGVHHVV